MKTTPALLAASSLCLLAFWSAPSRAQCPKIVIQVDNDIKGSGYSVVKPKNWITHSVGACHKNYTYLSHTVGDGTRKGKAIWTPKITVNGWYEIKTSYRATTNRSNAADYYLYDDNGGKKKVVINQKHSGDCTKKVVGTVYCKKGGTCRLVLDGDDGQSAAADITTFTLTKCSGTPPKNPCTKISAVKDYEVCSYTATTCAGTYNNTAGCKVYCAAAGMICTARFGGEPGCQKETTKFACNASNGHKSDWCECKLPAKPDAGPPPDSKLPAPDSKKPKLDTGKPGQDIKKPAKDTGQDPDGKKGTDGAQSADSAAVKDGTGTADSATGGRVSASCDCEVTSSPAAPLTWVVLAGLLLWLRRRSR